ncbi:MAG: McrB family protein [Ilumatobacteraceae bacterium]
MPHWNPTATSPTYELHHRWLIDVLPNSGSLFTPGVPIWTSAHLDELDRDFVRCPDFTPGRTYLDKLRDQLAPPSDGARQLMAEVHAVHFLGISVDAISAAKKVADLRAMLSWMTRPVDVPEQVVAAMSPGLAHPGQWALSRRDTQVTWIIEFSRAAKVRADGVPDDPWALKAFAESVITPSSDSARLAMLHLSRPESFERIFSTTHKAMVVDRFDDLSSGDDVDRQLLQIRAGLREQYGEDLDFYVEPLTLRWRRRDPWKPFMMWLERFRALPTFDADERDYKLDLGVRLGAVRQRLFDGDDTWPEPLRAALKDDDNLVQWRARGPFVEWVDQEPDAAAAALKALWAPGDDVIGRFQAFLAALPSGLLAQPGTQLNVGSVMLMAMDATGLPPAKIDGFRTAWKLSGFGEEPPGASGGALYERILLFLDELVHDARSWKVPLRDRLDAQGAVWSLTKWDREKQGLPVSWSEQDWEKFDAWRVIVPAVEDDEGDEPEKFDGEVDTTESIDGDEAGIDHIETAADELCVDRSVLDEIVQLLDDKKQVVLYGPPGTGKTYLALRLARALVGGDDARLSIVQFHPATTYEDFFEGPRPELTKGGQVTYRRTDGPLVELADKARADASNRYVMVIDEINRANLPKVFGELLFLLEYRHESARTLYRPGEPFQLPENLWFIATMNTADRSVALIDAAMRRRFHFVPFLPHEGPMAPLLRNWLSKKVLPLRTADFLDAVNGALLERLGDHLLIGPSHFMKSDLSEPALERVWTYNVFPLLEEQLWGQREEIAQWRWPEVKKRFAHHLTGLADPPPDHLENADVAEPPAAPT